MPQVLYIVYAEDIPTVEEILKSNFITYSIGTKAQYIEVPKTDAEEVIELLKDYNIEFDVL